VPANAQLHGFVPHTPVLERACLLISHAGHGAVMAGLRHGVPMVLVPWGRDQPGVAARAEAMGVAEVVPRSDCTQERLAEAISRVLNNVRYAEVARQASARLCAERPAERACLQLEQLLSGAAT